MLLGAFRARYPEFANASDPLVQGALDDAAGRLSATQWGVMRDQAQGLLAAHLLTLSPFGQGSRLASEDKKTTYGTDLDSLMRAVCGGPQVI